jgi:uncharacterized protein (TIGR01777 family)
VRVFVTGGSGFIGRRLSERLLARGDDVFALSRSLERARVTLPASVRLVEGDPRKPGPWMDALAGCDGVVHLAGEPVLARRWTDAHKSLVRASRVDSTRRVVEAAVRAGARTRVVVCASAIGYYGARGDETLDEQSPSGSDFLAEVGLAWEREAAVAGVIGQRRAAQVRIGVVLGDDGGALAKMVPPFRAFIGGPVGSGKQWVSWIHLDDLCGLFLLALDDARASGPLNGTAPEPCTMRDFAAGIGRALHRPSWLPAPAAAVRAAFGEGAAVILEGQRVLPRRALELGYRFRFPTLDGALSNLLGSD